VAPSLVHSAGRIGESDARQARAAPRSLCGPIGEKGADCAAESRVPYVVMRLVRALGGHAYANDPIGPDTWRIDRDGGITDARERGPVGGKGGTGSRPRAIDHQI
jgi:hypothetical protein